VLTTHLFLCIKSTIRKNYVLKIQMIQILNDWAILSPFPKSQCIHKSCYHTLTNWILAIGSYRTVVTLTLWQFNLWFQQNNSLIFGSYRTAFALTRKQLFNYCFLKIGCFPHTLNCCPHRQQFNYLLIPTENMFLLLYLFRQCLHSVYYKDEIDKSKHWLFFTFSVLLLMIW